MKAGAKRRESATLPISAVLDAEDESEKRPYHWWTARIRKIDMSGTKTHKTAAVIIPPGEVWPPIQEIRKRYDKHIRRWVPHITLLYPFRPREELQEATNQFARKLKELDPFAVELRDFSFFRHRRQSYTIWLSPEPKESLERLQSALLEVTPDYDDVVRTGDRFMPHLSVGQVKGEKALNELLDSLQASWRPVSFTVHAVSLIWREDPPDDVFRLAGAVGLGKIVTAEES